MTTDHALADPRIAEATALFQRAAATTGHGYQLLYIAIPGCGGKNGFHDYDNLRRAQAAGVHVMYMNPFFPGKAFSEKDLATGKVSVAPGDSVPARTINEAFQYLESHHLDMSKAPHAVLLDANGRFIREFDTTKGANFLNELQRATQPARPAARGNGRA